MHDGDKEVKKFIILIPVYNDWKSVFKLLENIDLQTAGWDVEVSVLIINDASIENRPEIKQKYKINISENITEKIMVDYF